MTGSRKTTVVGRPSQLSRISMVFPPAWWLNYVVLGSPTVAGQAGHVRTSAAKGEPRLAPMPTIPGYHSLQTLQEDETLVLLRGLRDSSAARVLLKTSVLQHAPPSSLARLEHEYAVRSKLDPAWAVIPLELSTVKGQTTLILADPGGETLERLLEPRPPLAQALGIAVSLCGALDELHRRQLIHKDIKPASLLVDASTGELRLMNFGVASELPREHRTAEPCETVEGTLAYMAPEQTGRMNRSIDSRSDLYSVGVTLYQLFTGDLPFAARDPVEWMHCHIARRPVPPHERVKDIPRQISAVIMKLLAKASEERYQTAKGAQVDLQRCAQEWNTLGHIAAFPLGTKDVSSRLLVPEKLYGRQRERDALLAAFGSVEATGQRCTVLVSGYSGVGKSSLVNELQEVMLPARGLFASGKFDQHSKGVPYFAIAQALQGLVHRLLARGEIEVAAWREALRGSVGVNGQLIVELVPELELIIGKQPPVPALSSPAAEHRFNEVFRQCLGAITWQQQPLVLFLDDLQWLDPASHRLFEYLCTQPDVKNLLLVAAYRDNEVTPAHPLALTLEIIRKGAAAPHELVLEPLSAVHVAELIADTVHCDLERAEPLARLVHGKTAGNPFFAIQFLNFLHDLGFVRCHGGDTVWTWDLEAIRAQDFTDNVVELMIGKLRRLAAATLEGLKGMACLGITSDVSSLAQLQAITEDQVHERLRQAVLAELVSRRGDTYRFVHDRIQAAAYCLVPEEQRAHEHLRIGRVLLAKMTKVDADEAAFQLLDQLNRGLTLVSDPDERGVIGRLSAVAGKRARAASSFALARDYFETAVGLLSAGTSKTDEAHTFELLLALSECEYLVGHFERAEELFNQTLLEASSDLDRARVQQLRIKLYQVAGRFHDAVRAGLEGLRALGVDIPESPAALQAALAEQTTLLEEQLHDRSIAELVDAPAATDPVARATLGLIGGFAAALNLVDRQLFPLLILKGLNASLFHGNTENACSIYVHYAHSRVFEDAGLAFAFSETALRLNEKLDDATLRGSLLFVHAVFIHPWRRPVRDSVALLDEAFVSALNVGDLVFAGLAASLAVSQRIHAGMPIDDTLAYAERSAAFARQSRNESARIDIELQRHFLLCLKGLTREPVSFSDETFDEDQTVAFVARQGVPTKLAQYFIMKQMLAYTYGRFELALDCARQVEPALARVMSFTGWTAHCFFHALTAAASYCDAPANERPELRGIIDSTLRQLGLWADGCPRNFLSRYTLLQAEAARIDGRDIEAMQLYDQAIDAARDGGLLNIESLANEVAARFHFSRGLDKTARHYLVDSRAAYLRWGALGKVSELDLRYPELKAPPARWPDATMGGPLDQLDLTTVVKALQAVSGEIVLSRLVQKLLTMVAQHAGADRGLLLLVEGERPVVEAEVAVRQDGMEVRFRHELYAGVPLPQSLIQFVTRTKQSVLIHEALSPNPYSGDEYLARQRPRSVLALPLIKQSTLVGVLYLENGLTPHAFTPNRVAVLELLGSQAAISLENARLYADVQRENMARRRAEERFSKAFHESPTPMAIVRIEDERFVDINQSNLELLGYKRDEIIGRSTFDVGLMHAQPRAMLLGRLAEAGAVNDLEIEIRTKAGQPRNTLYSVVTLDVGGEKCFLVTINDITERKVVEEQLRQSQKMEAIGRLAGGVAHDFNNLLTAINGYSSIAMEELDASHPTYDLLREILKAGERAAALTRQLLAHSRKQHLEAKVWSLNTIVKDMCPMLERLISEDVKLVQALSSDLGLVKVDRGQVEQVILNLVVNARDAMLDGGTLRLQTGNVQLDTGYWVTHLEGSAGPHAMLAVSDTGSGMSLEVKARLFEPFFTTKETGQGTGLGLSVVYGIVKQSGGSISVYSEEGVGTTFRVYFPLVDRDAQEETPLIAEKSEALRGHETILLVEDEESVRRFAAMTLEAKGYRVLQAANGLEALKTLESSAVDLVVSDVIMPELGGVALAKRLREHTPSPPILFMSGHAESALHRVDGAASEAMLQKPFSPFELAKKVREVLG